MLNKFQLNERYSHGQEVMIEYLKNNTRKGKCFFKSRHIARDLGMTSNEVGTNLKILSEECEDFTIERWSYSKSTTWHVRHRI